MQISAVLLKRFMLSSNTYREAVHPILLLTKFTKFALWPASSHDIRIEHENVKFENFVTLFNSTSCGYLSRLKEVIREMYFAAFLLKLVSSRRSGEDPEERFGSSHQ